MAKYFYVEVTDTFDGELFKVTRYKVRASSKRGAIVRINRHSGLGFRRTADYGDCLRFDSRSGETYAFVTEWDDSRINTDLA